jgi:hypothetical protein
VLTLAAAGSVFEMEVTVHRFSVLSFFLLRVLSLLWLRSGSNLLLANSLGSDSNGLDKAQLPSGYCCDNLPLIFAGGAQFHMALVRSPLYFGSVIVVSNHFVNARAFVLVSLPEG